MTVDPKLIRSFLQAQGAFVSGEQMAESLGISRVSVHNHLDQLRKEGFQFSAIRNRGYKLDKEPDHLHPALLEALLMEEPCAWFEDYVVCSEVDSTNNLAEIELSNNRKCPFFIVADSQTAGRGRRGRIWFSPRHKNLYLSVALRPSMPPSRLQTITLWLGLRMCQCLRDAFGLPVLIKWPNDLMLHGRKIAGMLTEARVDSESTRDLIFGLGLNVNATEKDFPEEIAHLASSLALNTGRTLNLTRLAHRIVLALEEAFQEFLSDEFSQELARSWPEFDFLRGQRVQADSVSGTALGITSNGSLRVERSDGSTAVLHSGEVSLHK